MGRRATRRGAKGHRLRAVVSRTKLLSIFGATITSELLPRAALLLFGHTSSALSILEHVTWAYRTNEPESETRSHLLVFTR